MRRLALVALLLAWLGVIAWSTLRSFPLQAAAIEQLHWYCILCGNSGGADFLLNMLLFFPLGLALRALGWRWQRAIPLMVALTIGIEVTQGTLLVGRDAALGDVLANSIGGALGWLALPRLRIAFWPNPSRARSSAWAVLAITIAIWFVTAAALRPAFDPVPWQIRRLEHLPYHDQYAGKMFAAQIDNLVLTDDSLDALPPWRDSLNLVVALQRDSEVTPPRRAPLLHLLDDRNHLQVDLTQTQNDVLLEVRLRGSSWLLHTPEWLYPNAMPAPSTNLSVLEWRWRPDRIELVRVSPGDSTPAYRSMIPLTVGLGWAFIHPYVVRVSSSAPFWSALWVAWWGALLGWMAGRLGLRDQMLFGVLMIGGYLGAGWITRLQTPLGEIAALLAGYLLLLAVSSHRTRRVRG